MPQSHQPKWFTFLFQVYWSLSFLNIGRTSCRYYPSCSHYTHEAMETHGFVRGLGLGLGRLLRCQPWGRFGYDPVPSLEKNG